MIAEEGILRSARLRLEPVRPADVAALHAHWTAPEVRRYLWDGRIITREEVGEVVRTSERLFREHGVGLWAMRPAGPALADAARPGPAPPGAGPAEDALLGCAGFWFFHDPPELELMFSLSPAYWGHGLARESAGSLLEFAFTRLGWDAVQASADAPNESSLKLLRRLGMRPAGERPGEFGPILVFRIGRSEWTERQHSTPT